MRIVQLTIYFFLMLVIAKAEKYELYRKHTNIGVMLLLQDNYPGAREYNYIPLPYIDIENDYILSRGDKGLLLYRAYENNRVLTMVGIAYYVPRTKKMDTRGVLDGYHEVKFDLPLVWHSNLYLLKGLELVFRLEQALRVTNSQKYALYFTYNKRLIESLFLETSLGMASGSKGYINNWFGVSEVEALNNNYFVGSYTAKSKINPLDVFINSYLYYDVSYNYSAILGLEVKKYVGDVTNSPILRKNGTIDMAMMIGLVYKF